MQNEGFVSSCSDGYCLDRSCPYNAAFGKCLVNDCPANSSTTCTGNTVGQNACGENCKNAATTPARPAIRQRQLPNATTQSATNAEIPVTKPKTATPARDTTTVAEHGSIVPEPSVIRTLHVAAPTARATIFRTSATTKATARAFTATAIVPATVLRPVSKAVTAMQRRRAAKAGRQRPAQPATVKHCTTTRQNPVQAVIRHQLILAIRRPAIV